MLPPPKKIWNRLASKVISKLSRFTRPEAITRTTRRLLGRLGTADPAGDHRGLCRCSCHRLQVYRSFLNNGLQVEGEEDRGGENGEFVEDDLAVDERAEEFIAKFHESLKLERLQHF